MISICWLFLLGCFVSLLESTPWNWTVNKTLCSLDDSHHNVLYIRADKNTSTFSATCFAFQTQEHGATSCEHNKFDVIAHGDLLPYGVHIICGCSGKPGIICYNEIRKHNTSSFFCVDGLMNVSMCGPSEYCGGSRSGCVSSSSCSNVTNECISNLESDCCCNSSFCNGWFEEKVISVTEMPVKDISLTVMIIVIIVSITAFLLICATMWILYRFKKQKRSQQLSQPQRDLNEMPLLSDKSNEEETSKEMQPPLAFGKIEKLEVLSRGQRGTRSVYTARCDGTIHAVKYFLLNDYSSWDAELKIYSLPLMNHDNLLKFIGYTHGGVSPDGLPNDHAIFTEYMPMGSLQDVLKLREVSWEEMLHIASGMMCGLAYLHSAIPSSDAKTSKPPIAHRDFKSRNVLLREDLTACVADFGLALPFDSARRTSNCGQVGTLRYMAPEVLDLAVNFSCDAFLRIDVYAAGLTLWEILQRCSKPPELQASPVYQQPFETHLNKHYPHCHNHPTPSEMQDIVFVKRLRPELPSSSSASQNIYDLIVTIEQCWDHDSEARPSAGCVHNRIRRIQQNVRSVSSGDNILMVESPDNPSKTNFPSSDDFISRNENDENKPLSNGAASDCLTSPSTLTNGDIKVNGNHRLLDGSVVA